MKIYVKKPIANYFGSKYGVYKTNELWALVFQFQ